MEEDADSLPLFFGVAAAVKKKGSGAVALKLLRFLAEYHPEGSEGRIQTLLEVARMSPKDPEVRKELAASLKKRFGAHPAFGAVVAKFPVESAPDPSEVAGRIARWLRFTPGGIYFMPGRGAGRLVEMKPALDVMRLEVQGTKLPLSLVSAERNARRAARDALSSAQGRRPEDPRRLSPKATRRRRCGSCSRASAASRPCRRCGITSRASFRRRSGPRSGRPPASTSRSWSRAARSRPPSSGARARTPPRTACARPSRRRRRPARSSWRGSMRSAPRRWRL